ncbi:sigma-54-dependent Fis family transcriptional regulator [Longibacter salinarum]|uniref:Sigma-54-dependent Fis family transcriptional regulator n=2 Tax=Longibacter salinarum TaxID=1850348 RepID=A0A2A8CV75_9BACT|nr:sigma-54-dependent Fis family transcriptional regulator [Longibacter salinarum]
MDRDSIQERFGIVGTSDAIKNVIDRARQVAKTEITVLLQGESGVGKELIADVLHELSMRRHEPMVVVNCGAIPEGLIESELFGAEKGAYTGAVQKRVGYFEEADGSTIFLDEIGEMPQEAQVRLLRVLETGKFSRVGSSQQIQSDVRVVAATNKNLMQEVKQGRFRKDLYYRLSTVLIDIPPLRDRKEDVMPIFETFLHRFATEYNSPMKKLTDDAKDLLVDYDWPGNVRELRNVAEQVVVLLRNDEVTIEDIRPLLRDLDEFRGTGMGASSTSLMRVEPERDRSGGGQQRGQASQGGGSDIRERELLYRAILEMRMEMSEMKDQIRTLVSNIGVVVPRDVVERSDFPGAYDDFVVVRDSNITDRDATSGAGTGGFSSDTESRIKDVAYEVDDSPRGEPDRSGETIGRRETETNGSGEPAEERSVEPEDIPTLEQAERDLITQALKRFDGNRRKTSRALGISERTLYRKLKDIDEDL